MAIIPLLLLLWMPHPFGADPFIRPTDLICNDLLHFLQVFHLRFFANLFRMCMHIILHRQQI
jgi:hypothetical protein